MPKAKTAESKKFLGIDGLWDEIHDGIGKAYHYQSESEDALKFKHVGGWPDTIEHSDGRSITVRRDERREKIVLEVKDRLSFPKEIQARLRRSFVEPKIEILGKVIGREIAGLLKVYAPAYAERKDQKQKRDAARERMLEKASEIADKLGANGPFAVIRPEDQEWFNHDHPKVTALVEADGATSSVDAEFQVTDKGVEVSFREPCSHALAQALIDALVPYVLPKIGCKKRGCDKKNLTDDEERRQELCQGHRRHT